MIPRLRCYEELPQRAGGRDGTCGRLRRQGHAVNISWRPADRFGPGGYFQTRHGLRHTIFFVAQTSAQRGGHPHRSCRGARRRGAAASRLLRCKSMRGSGHPTSSRELGLESRRLMGAVEARLFGIEVARP